MRRFKEKESTLVSAKACFHLFTDRLLHNQNLDLQACSSSISHTFELSHFEYFTKVACFTISYQNQALLSTNTLERSKSFTSFRCTEIPACKNCFFFKLSFPLSFKFKKAAKIALSFSFFPFQQMLTTLA